MTSEPSNSKDLRERVRASADADRFAVICALWSGSTTARGLAEGSGVGIARVQYFLRRWLDSGIVEIDEAGGSLAGRANFYRLRPGRLVVTNAEAGGIAPERLGRARGRALGLTLRQAMALAAKGEFGGEAGHAAFRLPMTLDPRSQRQGVRFLEETVGSIEAIGEEAEERLRANEARGTPAAVCLSFSERPPVKHADLDRVDLREAELRGRGPRNVRAPGALEDPLTLEIEYLLVARPYTVAELAVELGAGPASIRRALTRLEARGVVEVFGIRETRGAGEKSYVGEPLARFNEGTPGGIGEPSRSDYERWVIRRVAREALAAAQSDQLGAQTAAFAWLPMVLDHVAFEAVDRAVDGLSYKMLDLRSDSVRDEQWRSPDALSSSLRSLFFSVEDCDVRAPRRSKDS